jgi:hypothetical protein
MFLCLPDPLCTHPHPSPACSSRLSWTVNKQQLPPFRASGRFSQWEAWARDQRWDEMAGEGICSQGPFSGYFLKGQRYPLISPSTVTVIILFWLPVLLISICCSPRSWQWVSDAGSGVCTTFPKPIHTLAKSSNSLKLPSFSPQNPVQYNTDYQLLFFSILYLYLILYSTVFAHEGFVSTLKLILLIFFFETGFT